MKKLAERAIQGEKEAFATLIELCKQDLYKVARGFFRENDMAADAIQETILTAFENISALRKPEYFKTWLIRILINTCNSLKKTNSRYTSVDYVPDIAREDEGQANAEFGMLMDQLDEKYRIVLILYYAQDMSVAKISEIMGISKDAVKTRLKRGREKVRMLYMDTSVEVAI